MTIYNLTVQLLQLLYSELCPGPVSATKIFSKYVSLFLSSGSCCIKLIEYRFRREFEYAGRNIQ